MTSYNPDQWQEAIAGLASAGITATNPSVGTDGAAIPTSSTLLGASDGVNLQPLQVDASKNLKVNIAAGSSSGTQYTDGAAAPVHPIGTEIVFNNAGTMTAVSAANAFPVSGSISATNPSVGTDGAAIPTSSTLLGGSDGTNLQQLTVESASQHNLRTAVYNGANELAVDASGRLTMVPNSSVNAAQIAGIAPGLDNTNELRVSVYGKNAAAGDTPVLLDASGRVAVNVNTLPALPAGSSVIGSATIQAASGTALVADQANTELRVSTYVKTITAGDTALALGQGTMANSLPVTLASNQGNVPANIAQIGGAAVALGQAAMATSLPVAIASNQGNVPVNNAQWNGATPSVSNPVLTEDQIRWYINNGQSFSANTGKLTSGGAFQVGLSVWNPGASGKTLIVYRMRVTCAGSQFGLSTFTTADPAMGTAVTPVNLRAGNATATVTVCSDANTVVATAGTTFDAFLILANSTSDLLLSHEVLIIPAGNGLAMYLSTSTQNWLMTARWLEI